MRKFKRTFASLFSWLIFREKNPSYQAAGNLSHLQYWILAVAAGLSVVPLATWGLVIWGQYTLLGFMAYYALVTYILLQLLHFGTRKRS